MTSLAALRDILVPPRCAGCGRPGSWFCVVCRDECEPFEHALSPALTVVAAGAHEGPLREAIHRLKYGSEPGLAAELGALVAARVAADLATGVTLDAIVPVPLHPLRRRERGYDQAAALGSAIASACGLPLRDDLHRIRRGEAQATLGRTARAGNVRGAFAGVAGSLRGLRAGLVDDVATTGATLLDAAAAARACGARAIRAYVVAFEQ